MSQGADSATSATSWPAVVIIAGVAIVGLGVALNESGIAAGRYAIIAGVPIALLGVCLAVIVQRRASQAPPPSLPSPGACLERLAERHRFTRTKNGIHGRLKRRRVELSPKGEVIEIRALIKRPLDVGLTVVRGQPEGDARRGSRSGDAAFDAAYSVRGDEPERAAALLSERLRASLLERAASIDDGGVRLSLPPAGDRAIDEAMRAAVMLAGEVERASARVPCASFLREMREAWMAFAEANALATADTPLAMWGRMQELEVSARAIRDGFQQVHFEIAVDFPAPLGRKLTMRPASSSTQFDRSWPPIGHPKFDKFFILKSEPSEDAPRLVGGETREAILALRDEGIQLRVSDKGLWAWVGFHRDRPEVVPKGLACMVRIASRIIENAARYPRAHGTASPGAPSPSVQP